MTKPDPLDAIRAHRPHLPGGASGLTSHIGIARERPNRRARARWFFVRHYRWLRRRGSRDGSTVYLPL
jgi:hypothetical protein